PRSSPNCSNHHPLTLSTPKLQWDLTKEHHSQGASHNTSISMSKSPPDSAHKTLTAPADSTSTPSSSSTANTPTTKSSKTSTPSHTDSPTTASSSSTMLDCAIWTQDGRASKNSLNPLDSSATTSPPPTQDQPCSS